MRRLGLLVCVCLLVASSARAQQALDDHIDGPAFAQQPLDGRNTTGPGFPELDNRSLVVKLTKLFRF